MFKLKIMKLFLLNSMENKKSRKISFTILPFFYNFIHISKVLLKKKREKVEQCWAGFSPAAQSRGKSVPAPAHAPARWQLCTEVPDFLAN